MDLKYINSNGSQFGGIPMNLQLFADTDSASGSADSGVASPQLDTAYASGFDESDDISFVSENEADDSSLEVANPKDIKQDPKIDSAFAKIRKEKEALEKMTKEQDSWVERNFSKDFGIKTWKEYQAMMDKQLSETKLAEYREKGYDPDVIREIVKDDPEILNALNQRTPQQEQQADNDRLVSEYQELAGKFPDLVTSPEDIPAEVWKLNDMGLSLTQAFMAVNHEAVLNRANKVGKQQALNNINSKAHLKTEGDGAGETNDIHMPADTLSMYMDMGMTRKQAFAHYKKLYG